MILYARSNVLIEPNQRAVAALTEESNFSSSCRKELTSAKRNLNPIHLVPIAR